MLQSIITYSCIIAGIMLFLLGAGFIGLYVLEAVIMRLGEADQSLLFWYLPILFIGIAALGYGVKLGLHGRRRFRGVRQSK